MTNSGTEIRFTGKDIFQYTTASGCKITVTIGFEGIEDLDVMTYTVDSTSYHFINLSYEEFMGRERPLGEVILEKLKGFWHMAGVNGELKPESKEQGFAYEFTEGTFSTYNNYEITSENVEFSFIAENTISYIGSNGIGYTAEIRFENIDGIDVMTYTINSTDYHYVKTTYNEFIKDAELSQIAIGFWVMVGSGGNLSDETKAEGNAIEFTKDTMTIYTNHEVSTQSSDYTIENNNIIYDFNGIVLTARIEFKTVDGVEVLSATILMQEYYFVRSTYEEFMAGR
jgi:hypothetical protein